jgi:hypothetical protein
MISSSHKPLHPTPHHTALWLAKVSVGLLLGGALWLMGVRAYENKVSAEAAPLSSGEVCASGTPK